MFVVALLEYWTVRDKPNGPPVGECLRRGWHPNLEENKHPLRERGGRRPKIYYTEKINK